MLKKYLLILAVVSTASACSKDNDTDNGQPTDPDAFKQEVVTKISFSNPVAEEPTTVSFMNRTTALGYFDKKTSGEYRIEFHGLNGRLIVESNPRNIGISSNLCVFPIRGGDTIRVYKNGKKYRDFVTEIEDNINDGIRYPIGLFNTTITQGVADKAKADLNNYTSGGGALSTIMFSKS